MMKCLHLEEKGVNEPNELLDDGYAIQGCCGGNCYVIWGIKYCPFCGEMILKESEDKEV